MASLEISSVRPEVNQEQFPETHRQIKGVPSQVPPVEVPHTRAEYRFRFVEEIPSIRDRVEDTIRHIRIPSFEHLGHVPVVQAPFIIRERDLTGTEFLRPKPMFVRHSLSRTHDDQIIVASSSSDHLHTDTIEDEEVGFDTSRCREIVIGVETAGDYNPSHVICLSIRTP